MVKKIIYLLQKVLTKKFLDKFKLMGYFINIYFALVIGVHETFNRGSLSSNTTFLKNIIRNSM